MCRCITFNLLRSMIPTEVWNPVGTALLSRKIRLLSITHRISRYLETETNTKALSVGRKKFSLFFVFIFHQMELFHILVKFRFYPMQVLKYSRICSNWRLNVLKWLLDRNGHVINVLVCNRTHIDSARLHQIQTPLVFQPIALLFRKSSEAKHTNLRRNVTPLTWTTSLF